MVILSPRRFKTRLFDKFTRSTKEAAPSTTQPIPIFQIPLSNATRSSRLSQTVPTSDSTEIEDDGAMSWYSYWCPAVVVRSVNYLNTFGLDEEGLYRVPGSSDTIKRLKHEFDCHADISFETFTSTDIQHGIQVADVASLLKLFLRELPEPIIPAETAKKLAAASITTEELRAILSTEIGPYEFYLLSILFTHLTLVDSRSSNNKMDISNLAIVFCSSSNLGIGSKLFMKLAKADVWAGLRCQNETTSSSEEADTC